MATNKMGIQSTEMIEITVNLLLTENKILIIFTTILFFAVFEDFAYAEILSSYFFIVRNITA